MLNIENSYTSVCVVLQEKASNVMDKASNAAQSAQDSMQQVLIYDLFPTFCLNQID